MYVSKLKHTLQSQTHSFHNDRLSHVSHSVKDALSLLAVWALIMALEAAGCTALN